jgi:(S)-3,5-dihydroxyphenylglycine transaminase
MNFLNEITFEFPDAISLAPGRPLERFFGIPNHFSMVQEYVKVIAEQSGRSEEDIWRDLGQYARTNGTINETIAAHLSRDENIEVSPEAVIVTVGAQEAMLITLMGLFDPARDILLVSDPTYIGITGLARFLGIGVIPIPSDDDGLDPDAVEAVIVKGSPESAIRAIYVIPDFNNPLGTSLSIERRRSLIEICSRHNVLIIEDNPYGMFAYDHPPQPTLKALDRTGIVLYIGSFSKTLFPGLRVGYLVADQTVGSGGTTLAQELSRVKSLTTVNTSPLLQATVAAALSSTGGSLQPFVEPRRLQYKRQRDVMLNALDTEFGNSDSLVTWNRPSGGFFTAVALPFPFGLAEMRACAADYGVIVAPMQFFSLLSNRTNYARLSFSYAGHQEIAVAIERLAHYVHAQRAYQSRSREHFRCADS